ncbi:MAG: energy-coupling factor transporter transmembrane protein EcfT [Actinobacteria bacterium]|nr:energy-coupling factor transporter transmembrane protein EcfT [Actinomycetota bacterium]
MIDDKAIAIGQYNNGRSFLHKLDPRLKIIAIIIWTFLLFFYTSGWELLVFSGLLLIVLAASRIPLFSILKSLKVVIVIVVVTFMMQALLTPGKVVVQWGFLNVTDSGLANGILYSGRILLLVVLLSILTATTPPIKLADGMESLLGPLKAFRVPVGRLATLISIILMFIPNILEQGRKLIRSQAAKGADFDSWNLPRRLKNLTFLLTPLFVKVFCHADALGTAMYSRCYASGEKRTRLHPLKIGLAETVATAAVIALTIAIKYVVPG